MQHFVIFHIQFTYLLSNSWPWKTTEEINIVYICLSVGIFKCNSPFFQINYTGKMITGHYYVGIQIRFSISKLVQCISNLLREDTEVTTWTISWWHSNIPALLRIVKLRICSQLWRKPDQQLHLATYTVNWGPLLHVRPCAVFFLRSVLQNEDENIQLTTFNCVFIQQHDGKNSKLWPLSKIKILYIICQWHFTEDILIG